MQRSKYTAEFKAEAVKQVVDKGLSLFITYIKLGRLLTSDTGARATDTDAFAPFAQT